MTGATVVILGEQVAYETDRDGFYEFEFSLEPGEHTIYAYTTGTDFYRDDFVIVEGMEHLDWHIILDVCVDDQTSLLTGKVTAKNGNVIKGARIGISDLFLETETNKDGVYYLTVPPGKWTVTIEATGYDETDKTLEFVGPEEPGMESITVEIDVKLSAK
ncbi:MAG: carboxypeptidase regulatory-like domain-containing protein [bacterium]|nr:carboxypeptidase regulatory-like domain-containing protein [bacterium]